MSFSDTVEGQEFIASGDSRETSPEIMEAIAFFARTYDEAVSVWNGDFDNVCRPHDIWERVTKNGLYEPSLFFWGAARNRWWDDSCASKATPSARSSIDAED